MRILSAALVLTVVAPLSAADTLTKVGAAAAVAGTVSARSKGAAAGHVLSSGKPVFLDDHVTSDAKGRLQVLLLDETVFTLGPNADMVIDDFVYDPSAATGKVQASVVKGAFRFVTGKIASKEPDQMKVKLPNGTIGIRGTVVSGMVSGDSALVVLNGPGADANGVDSPGAISVENGGVTVDINTPGFGTKIDGANPPSEPFLVPPEQMNSINGALAPAPEGKQEEGGGGSPESESGQEVSDAITAVADTSGALDQAAEASNVTNTSSQGGAHTVTNATWSDLQGYASGGIAYFGVDSGQNAYTCGGSCSGGGTFNFKLYVDFAARLLAPSSQSTSSIQLDSGPLSATANFTETSFASFTGSALATVSNTAGPGVLQTTGSSDFNGTTFQFKNRGDAVGAEVEVNMQFADTNSATATGRATGAQSPPPPLPPS